MNSQRQFFTDLASKKELRPTVRSIAIRNGFLLVQAAAEDESSCFAFPGGQLEYGELAAERLKTEYEEELGMPIEVRRYLFLVENRFRVAGEVIHTVEHYFHVSLRAGEVETREPHLTHHWLPLVRIAEFDVRPWVVRDALAGGNWQDVRHLVTPFDTGARG